MSTYGQPLELRHGVGLYSPQTNQGTAVAPATSIGPATFGHTKRGNNRSFRGPGSPNRYAVKGGLTVTEWEMRWEGVTANVRDLLMRGVRTGGVLPWNTLGFGYKDDAGTPAKSADQIQDAKIGQIELSFDAGTDHSPISGSISGIGGLVTVLTNLDPALDSATPFYTYEAVAEMNGSAYEMERFSVSINHHLQPRTVIRGAAAASFPRGPKYFVEGDEEITGSITLLIRSGVNPFADCPAATDDLVVGLTNLCDSETMQLTLTNLSYDNERFQAGDDGLRWTVDFEATSFSIGEIPEE